jgi:hypothetical protein
MMGKGSANTDSSERGIIPDEAKISLEKKMAL